MHLGSVPRLTRKAAAGALLAVPLGAFGFAGVASSSGVAAATAEFHPLITVAGHGTSFKDSTSNNWSGYNQGILSTDKTYTSISADWVVPTATQHTAGQAEDSATWIGIGGGCLDTSCDATDETLIQAGTDQNVAADGTASYSAWWELVPVPSVNSSVTVNPGDLINCSISEIVPGLWSISLSDETDGQSFSETLPYTSTLDTAEWIEETPLEIGTDAGLASLPNLSTVSFTNASVNGANAGLTSDEGVVLTDSNGNPIATPSAPSSAGSAFNDCAWATTCAAP
jgi:Peptidase A4 family